MALLHSFCYTIARSVPRWSQRELTCAAGRMFLQSPASFTSQQRNCSSCLCVETEPILNRSLFWHMPRWRLTNFLTAQPCLIFFFFFFYKSTYTEDFGAKFFDDPCNISAADRDDPDRKTSRHFASKSVRRATPQKLAVIQLVTRPCTVITELCGRRVHDANRVHASWLQRLQLKLLRKWTASIPVKRSRNHHERINGLGCRTALYNHRFIWTGHSSIVGTKTITVGQASCSGTSCWKVRRVQILSLVISRL